MTDNAAQASHATCRMRAGTLARWPDILDPERPLGSGTAAAGLPRPALASDGRCAAPFANFNRHRPRPMREDNTDFG
jgi:hypothetical protein